MEMFERKLEWLQKQQNGNRVGNYLPVIENCPVPIFTGFFDHHVAVSPKRSGICPNGVDLMRYGGNAVFDMEFSEAGRDEVPARSCLTGTDCSLPGSPNCRAEVLKVAKMEAAERDDMDTCVEKSSQRQQEMAKPRTSRTKRLREEIEEYTSEGDGVRGSARSSNKKNLETKKQDYIHVRARRGQATDSHSLAERARREKISKKMKYLQDLVPGCNKVAGRAGMLDEIINYVQSLQRQVEFLSMKLATLSPTQQTGFDSFSGNEHHVVKQSFPTPNFLHTTFPHLHLMANHQAASNEPETLINPQEIPTTSPLLIPEMYTDSSPCYHRLVSLWDSSKQIIHQKPIDCSSVSTTL